jgi:hypothetical protein
MTIKKTNYKPQTSAPRKTNRSGKKNLKPSPVSHDAFGLIAARLVDRGSKLLSTVWQKLGLRLHLRRKLQKLRVCDVASLGDKRFVAVVEYGSRRFLVGGGAGSVSLLSRLDREDLPEPLYAGREVRSHISSGPHMPAVGVDTSPFNVRIAEATAGTRLAV